MDSQSVRVLAELENEQMDVDREENEAELQGAHSETQVTQPTKTVFQSNKRLKADVWKEYIPVGVGIDGKKRGSCIYCSKELVIEVRNGTSSLKRHLEICPVKPPSDDTCRLLPENVQALLCTRNWLRGYPELEGDIEDNFDEEATNVASSSGV